MTKQARFFSLNAVDAGYGKKRVLRGVDIGARQGTITAIVGPNGAGKSTVLRVAHGIIPAWKGSVVMDQEPLNGLSSAQRVRRGVVLCPQGERVFSGLTVKQNLKLGASHLRAGESNSRIAAVLETFPKLKTRLGQDAGTLSGGEQQAVAFARAIVSKPRLLLLDEPSLGLSPSVLAEVFEKICDINKRHGTTILVVEQKVRKVLLIADFVYCLRLGEVVFGGAAKDLAVDTALLRRLFF